MRKCRHIGSILFFIVFLVMFFCVQAVFLPMWAEDTTKYPQFYNLEDNIIDVLFVGASHSFLGIYPMEIYDNYGIRSFELSSPNQNMMLSYFQLVEAYKTQKIRYCFLDMSGLFYSSTASELDNNQRYKMIVSQPFSKNKINLLRAYCDTSETALSLVFPLYQFHSRWNELSATDFQRPVIEKYRIAYGGQFIDSTKAYLGYSTQYVPREIEMTDKYESAFLKTEQVFESERTELPRIEEEAYEYFELIYQFCQDNGIKLIPIKVPSIVTWGEAKNRLTVEFLSNYDLPFIDMTYSPNYVEIDWSKDTYDRGSHLNFRGGLKVSEYLGKWMLDNCTDLRLNEYFPSKEKWDEDAIEYEKLKTELLLSMRTDQQKIQELFDMINANKSNYLICLSVKNDMSTFWNEDMDNYMRTLGLTETFYGHRQQSYIAVIDRGEVTYEHFTPKSLIYKSTFSDGELHSLYIKSENYKQGNSSSILIDGKQYSMNGDGLNIIIYDTEKKEVVKQAIINLTVSPHRYSEK